VYCINQQIANQFLGIWKLDEIVAPFAKNKNGGGWIQTSETGTRIEYTPKQRSVYIQTIRGGMGVLLEDLSRRGKLAKRETPIEEEYV
jgi:hypothetical protein